MPGLEAVRVGVIGASGYSGAELIRLLARHPYVELTYLAGSRSSGADLTDVLPHLASQPGLPSIQPFTVEACKQDCDVAFVGLPSGISGPIAADLWATGMRVIDLSGDLRLPAETYSLWYAGTPVNPLAQAAAVYGLTEWQRSDIRNASLIANPGCYATTALLALLPAVRGNLWERDRPFIIDAKSGVSGAGRSPSPTSHFGELGENFFPYKVGRHQHIPEIEQALGPEFQSRVVLTTQLLPVVRGIYASCYIPLNRVATDDEVYDLYQSWYADEPFISVLPPGAVPQLKHVRGSNICQLGLHVDKSGSLLQVFSVTDNLQKGAAGQAVQNFNVMHGMAETAGLEAIPFFP